MTHTDSPVTRGVILQPVDAPGDFVPMVSEIESLGYANLWCTDSSLHARNVYSYLTLAAMNTTSLRLGTAVTNPLTRHPAITASAAATIDEVSAGRMLLGIGVGDRPLLALGYEPSRLADLEATIEDLRRLWGGETVDRHARSYELDEAHMRIPARSDIPIYISASGPRTFELAGRIADGVLVMVGLFDEAIEWAISCVRKGASAAGREMPHIAVCAYGAINDDHPEESMGPARTIASWFPQTAPYVCELAGLDSQTVQAVRATYSGGEFQEAGKAASLLPDTFVRRVALSGGRAEATAQIQTALRAGADSVQVFPLGPERMATVRAFVDSWDAAVQPA